MKRTLAVIAGTFNPLTNAHLALGRAARKKLGAECLVLFIPTRTGFMKTWKHMTDEDIMPDDVRCRMLNETLVNEGFLYDRCEVEVVVSGKTYDTLRYLAEKYQAEYSDVYFVCGSDKLPELNLWYCSDELLTVFRFLVVQRNYDNVETLISDNPFLKQYRASFTLLEGEDKFQDISATEVRKALRSGNIDTIKSFVPDMVYRNLERMVQYG